MRICVAHAEQPSPLYSCKIYVQGKLRLFVVVLSLIHIVMIIVMLRLSMSYSSKHDIWMDKIDKILLGLNITMNFGWTRLVL